MFRTREVQNLKRPSERIQGSVYQEMTIDASAIDRVEAQSVTRSDDLAALAKDADQNWFNVALEYALNWLSRPTLLVSLSTFPIELLSVIPYITPRFYHIKKMCESSLLNRWNSEMILHSRLES